jgi:hypothetical protein
MSNSSTPRPQSTKMLHFCYHTLCGSLNLFLVCLLLFDGDRAIPMILDVAYKNHHSLIANSGPKLCPTDGAALRRLLVGPCAVLAKAHVPARRQEDVGRVSKANRALLPCIALEKIVPAVDVLQVEGQITPLNTPIPT